MEEKKIIDTKSFLQTSVKSKIMAVRGHDKEENLIYIIYTSLREVSLWRFPKDRHTESTGKVKKVAIHVLVLQEC